MREASAIIKNTRCVSSGNRVAVARKLMSRYQQFGYTSVRVATGWRARPVGHSWAVHSMISRSGGLVEPGISPLAHRPIRQKSSAIMSSPSGHRRTRVSSPLDEGGGPAGEDRGSALNGPGRLPPATRSRAPR